MLSDVLIIKRRQYIPLDPLTTLNGMMINYIIKRSCATHLWTWDLKLKIKHNLPSKFPALKLRLTQLGNMLRVPHLGLFQSIFISIKYLESQMFFM